MDEARTGADKVIANVSFQFASEAGKARLRPDGSPRKILTWKGFMTLSSEKSLSHYTTRAGDQLIAGSVVRMPSIDVSGLPPIDSDEARAIKEAAYANYGHVGPRFALACPNGDELRKWISEAEVMICRNPGTPTAATVRRVFATLKMVGDIMRYHDIISASDLDVDRCIRWGWETFLAGEEAAALNPAEQSVDALLVWLRSNPGVVRRVGDKFGHREVIAWYDDLTVYIPKDNLSKIPTLTTSTKAVLEELDDRCLLEWSGKNRVHSFIPKAGDNIPHYRLGLIIDTPADDEDEQAAVEEERLEAAENGGSVWAPS
jgi:hypothetical protein